MAALRQVQFYVADLGDDYLGMAFAGAVGIDDDAAGLGWFVDVTPERNEEFIRTSGGLRAERGPAARGVDLLTVITHELGHVLGLGDDDYGDGVMSARLGLGVRVV